MDRLTKRIEDKVYYTKGKYSPTTICAEMEKWEVRECMKKLADYEDAGLLPKEINSLSKEDKRLVYSTELLKSYDKGFRAGCEYIIKKLNEEYERNELCNNPELFK